MGEVPGAFQEQALAEGAFLNELGRLAFPASLVEDVIDSAVKSFVLHGRVPEHDLEIGGERVFFGTGGAAVQT